LFEDLPQQNEQVFLIVISSVMFTAAILVMTLFVAGTLQKK